jgi:capsular exopolysaccharide synthesis family protein
LRTVSLSDVVPVLRRHKWLILSAVVLCVAATAYKRATQVIEYGVTASLRLVNERRTFTEGISEDPATEPRGSDPADATLTQINILQSGAVLGPVVDETGFRIESLTAGLYPSAFRAVDIRDAELEDTLRLRFDAAGFSVTRNGQQARAAYGSPVRITGVEFRLDRRPPVDSAVVRVMDRATAISRLRRRISVGAPGDAGIIAIRFAAPDPGLASRLVPALAATAERVSAEMAQQAARRRRVFIEEQLRQTDAALQSAQDSLSAFRSRRQIYDSESRIASRQASIAELQSRRTQLESDYHTAKTLLTRLQSAPVGASSEDLARLVYSPALASNAAVSQLYSRWIEAATEMAGLTSGVNAKSAQNPEVERLAAQMRTTQTNLLNAVRSHVASLAEQLRDVEAQQARGAAEMRALPESVTEENRLAQHVDAISRLADELRSGLQRARIAEAVEAGQLQVLDVSGTVPTGGVGRRYFVLALVLGLFVGGAGAFVREMLDSSLRRPDELESVLRVPDLGVIPSLTRGLPTRRNLLRGASRTADDSRSAPASPVPWHAAEAYRFLRANLNHARSERRIQSIVVTSQGPAEGKTTVTANLAQTFANQGERVLIIDADLHRPTLHRMFQLSREPGLTDVLQSAATLEQAIHPSGSPNLSILPAGSTAPNATELLSRADMTKVLQAVRNRFDLFIVDTPPLGGTADAAILGAKVDGVIVVVRAGATDSDRARRVVSQLERTGAHVIGAVMNDPDAELLKYGRVYAYPYEYAYYSSTAG